ncbi:MAG TPA: hypothetical protein VH413_17405 [Verrucomicrobiae bacterium]|jgi:hypothetical protein|nr:hypothetical protein [Verrucomicrobiae bacterium]
MGHTIQALRLKGIEFKHRKRKCVGFHGTHKGNAEQIRKAGFDLAFAREKGCWLGTGIYFFDNAPYAGHEFALCFATHLKKAPQPIVIQADINFIFLLDLNDDVNGPLFWKLFNLLRSMRGNSGVDENFTGHFIGTTIAKEMKSDGVAWRFPMQEAGGQNFGKMQNGFCVKKITVIGPIRI